MAASDYDKLQATTTELVQSYRNEGECILRDIRAEVEFKIYRHKLGHSINVFGGSKVINSLRPKIVDFIWNNLNHDLVKEYDPDCLRWEAKESGPNKRIVYQLNKLGWPLWPRSFVSLWWKVELEDRTCFYYAATTDSDWPEKPTEDVRGTVTFSVLELIDEGLTQTRVTRLLHLDPATHMGSIPAAIVNMMASRQMVGFLNWLGSKV